MSQHEIAMIRLASTDFERTKNFYQSLFDWEMHDISDDFLGFSTPGELGGGFLRMNRVEPGNSAVLHIEVVEFERYADKVAELGGKVLGDMEEVPGYGSFLPITDPDGNHLTLWRPV